MGQLNTQHSIQEFRNPFLLEVWIERWLCVHISTITVVINSGSFSRLPIRTEYNGGEIPICSPWILFASECVVGIGGPVAAQCIEQTGGPHHSFICIYRLVLISLHSTSLHLPAILLLSCIIDLEPGQTILALTLLFLSYLHNKVNR